ncbi:MAG: tryptophan synthase subunit alpha [Bacteroidota bacterium]
MSNRIQALFAGKSKDVLNVYFTAGHPQLEDTKEIIQALDDNGVDLIEVGLPYSDPLADGETIQNSSQQALQNGITLDKIMDQIAEVRETTDIPLVQMGYYNQMMQYGFERFLERASEAGVDGLIIPDLPMHEYEERFQALFEKHGLVMSFLITPETEDDRIRQADRLSSGFLYVVSKSSITGSASDLSDAQQNYFERIDALDLDSPRLIGFGIHDKKTYDQACENANGAIIGSAFIRALEQDGNIPEKVERFIEGVRGVSA